VTNLELQRRLRGLTQDQLAEKIMFSRARISWLENCNPPIERVGRRLRGALEQFFGIPLEELLREATAEARGEEHGR